jgi:guanine nucleotide-binding protein subunit alpha
MVLEEDNTANRLTDSLSIWQELTAAERFAGTPFILFLNRADVFEQKINHIPLRMSLLISLY